MDGGEKRRHAPWWTNTVKEAIKPKTRCLRTWLKQRTQKTRDEYATVRNKVERIKRDAKKRDIKQLGKKLKEDEKSNK